MARSLFSIERIVVNAPAFYDIEIAPNRAMVGVKLDGEHRVFDYTEPATEEQKSALFGTLADREVVGYNNRGFDTFLLGMIQNGATPRSVYEFGQAIIESNTPSWQLARERKVQAAAFDEIDLMHFCPRGRLKAYEGRLGLEIRDLPFDPHADICAALYPTVERYLLHDLDATEALHRRLEPEFNIRRQLETKFGVTDLLKKTAARSAEAILISEYLKLETTVERADIRDSARRCRHFDFPFDVPDWITKVCRGTPAEALIDAINGTMFSVDNGRRPIPDREWPSHIEIDSGVNVKFGLGGLHTDDPEMRFVDIEGADFGSYYPHLFLRPSCMPGYLNPASLGNVYQTIIEDRLSAKASGDKITADALKLIINATFGLTGDSYSSLYFPPSFLNITVGGQLLLIAMTDKLRRAH